MPTNRKDTFECPPEHLDRWANDINTVDRLLLAGWRAAEPHALALLEEHLLPGYELAVCAPSTEEASLILDNLGHAGRKG